MKLTARSVIVGILVIFLVYAIIVAPVTTAGYFQTVFVAIADAFRSVFTFFDTLLNR
jgi:hypothetical protein